MVRLSTLLVVLLIAAAWAQAPTIQVAGTPRQGNPIFLTVRGVPAGTTGTVRWNNERWPMAPADDQGRLRTVLAVAVDMPHGPRPLIVELADGTQVHTTVTVLSRWFPEQHIWIPPSTLASYDTPRNRADDRTIIEHLKVFDPVQHWHGSFHLPIHARESTQFGDRRTYNGWMHGWHKGLDLAGAEGTAIHAPAGGVVVHVARGLVNGNTVAINHGLGLGTVYLHMQTIAVKVGQTLHAGDVIGHVGGTGGFAPHLHWEARVNGVPIDPHSLLWLPEGWR
ncbi:MAG: M23 family metallopeptidase [Candidatus Xenobia bacterium]